MPNKQDPRLVTAALTFDILSLLEQYAQATDTTADKIMSMIQSQVDTNPDVPARELMDLITRATAIATRMKDEADDAEA